MPQRQDRQTGPQASGLRGLTGMAVFGGAGGSVLGRRRSQGQVEGVLAAGQAGTLRRPSHTSGSGVGFGPLGSTAAALATGGSVFVSGSGLQHRRSLQGGGAGVAAGGALGGGGLSQQLAAVTGQAITLDELMQQASHQQRPPKQD